MPCTPPLSTIGPLAANNRVKIFTDKKKIVLDTVIGSKLEVSSVFFSPKTFLQLLAYITDKTANYTGLRVYFATYRLNLKDPTGNSFIPNGKEENMTLIFVPTKKGTDGNIMVDDLTTCMINVNDSIRIIDPTKSSSKDEDTLSNWIKHYHNYRIPILENDGVNNASIKDFKETKSIWYDINFFKPNGQSGLVDYVECLMKANPPLSSIEIKFAAYQSTEDFNYQLTLIFEFYQSGFRIDEQHQIDGQQEAKTNTSYFSFLRTDVVGAFDGASDTGNPCPPNTCAGGDLPLP